VTERQAREVKSHLDEARHNCDLTMACIWGATRATAPADRWDMAAADLQAAADAIAAAQAALAAMDKEEAYCTACGGPVLHLTAGWTHISTTDHVEARQAGHEPELDWRPVGADGKGNDGG
jgi:hypothetical protein